MEFVSRGKQLKIADEDVDTAEEPKKGNFSQSSVLEHRKLRWNHQSSAENLKLIFFRREMFCHTENNEIYYGSVAELRDALSKAAERQMMRL